MSDQVRLKNTLGAADTPWDKEQYIMDHTKYFSTALFLTTFLSFIIWIVPDSTSPLKSLYFVYVVLFLAVLRIMGPVAAAPVITHAVVLSLLMFAGEWLFSSNDVLTFLAVFLVGFVSLLVTRWNKASLSAFCCHLFVLMFVFIALCVAIFPIYAGVWEPAIAGVIASSIVVYTVVPTWYYF